MPKLNQILAIEKGVKNAQNQAITEVYKIIQKPALFAGIARNYRPKDEDGDKLPSESTLVQQRAQNLLKDLVVSWTKLLDITLTKDTANTTALADIVVDGKVIAAKVPVPTLLNLEKQLVDIHTVIAKLPILDPSEEWTKDAVTNSWSSKAAETTKTKKVPKPFIKAPATQQHPAQVEVVHEDVLQGTWTTIKFSGAMPQATIANMLAKVEELQVAVKFARESANLVEAPRHFIGEAIFGHILG
jgi:hypothetical protein